MKFTELDLDERIMHAIEDLGFTDCTDVQAETFTHTLNGRDVAVQSQTGTGKTAAFLISIFQLWVTEERFKGSKALVVAPTRELAIQIERDAKAIGKYLPYQSACFYGGVGYGAQEKAVADGVELIIGTPGRLLDFNQSGKIDFRELGILVIDEADRLFDMGFYPDIRKIMKRSRPKEERVTMLYSATLGTNVRNISWQFMNSPAEIEIAPEQMTVEKVDQVLYHISKDEKFKLLLGVLKDRKPQNALIFCNTKRATEIVAKKLQLNGYPCEFIMGDLPQKKRMKIIDSMKAGEIQMLCATDVAARGLHVDDLDMVVNYDLPEDPEAYVHRIGRTARAGKTGRAVSLACERFVYSLEPIQELIGQKIPVQNVTSDLISEDESVGRRLSLTHRDQPQTRRGGDRRHPSPRGRSSDYRGRGRDHRGRGGDSRPRDGDSRSTDGDSRPPNRRPAAKHVPGPKHAAADNAARDHGARSGGKRRQSERKPITGKAPSRDSSVEDRMAYYREKYGEDFQSKNGPTKNKSTPAARKSSEQRSKKTTHPTDQNGGGRKEGSAESVAASSTKPQPAEKKKQGGKRRKGILGKLFGREE